MRKIKIMPVRMSKQDYKDLRKIAYLMEIPMAEIIRQGIELKIKEHKKMLTNSDIAV